MATERTVEQEKALIKSMLERWAIIAEIEGENHKNALEEARFAAGDQWPDDIRKDREADDRPCVTINRVQQMIKQVVNDMRQNRAGIRVHPAGEGARPDIAELRAGLIRHIEAKSAAPQAYATAAGHAVERQIGYLRVIPEYENAKSFHQSLRIAAIADPGTVYFGAYQAPDASDATECFIITDIPRANFKAQYPKAKEVPLAPEIPLSQDASSWSDKDTIRIGEAFLIEDIPDTLYLFQDGSVALASELPGTPPKEVVIAERSTARRKSIVRKFTAVEILEEAEYECPWLLIVPVLGEETRIDGKVIRLSLTRHAMDPQRVYNYSRTMTTEQVALAPRAPWVIAEGQLEGHEDEWGTANSKNHAYLTYKPQTVAGQLVGAPQRQPFTGVPAGALSDLQLASEEIKAVTGIYDAALGAKGNETSGKAILARQREADNATFHYVDNLNRAIQQVGSVINKLLPVIYDTERVIRILGEDGTEVMARINAEGGLPLGDGDYDVVLDTGPSYETKRIEAANSMTQFMQAVPNAAPIIADLVAKNMDWPGARQIAERLKVMLPSQVLQAEGGEGQIPPQVQMQVQEMQQVIGELQKALQEQLTQNEQLQQEKSSEAVKTEQENRKIQLDEYKAKTERLQVLVDAAMQAKGADDTEANLNALAQQLQELRTLFSLSTSLTKEPINGPTI